MWKKCIAFSGILLALFLVIGFTRNASVDAGKTVSENDEVKREIAERLGKNVNFIEDISVSDNDRSSVSGNEPNSDSSDATPNREDVDSNRDDDNAATQNTEMESDVLNEEGCLYVIRADGNRLGSVPIVSGNAFVFMQSEGSVWQGDYDSSVADSRVIDWSFYRDESLTYYDITSHVQSIGQFAFARSALQEIVIPDGVTSIGYAAFYHCDQLKKVEIPDSVTEIKEHAFENTPWLNDFMENGSQDFLIVGDGVLLAYRGTEKQITLPDEVKTVADGAIPEDIEIIK